MATQKQRLGRTYLRSLARYQRRERLFRAAQEDGIVVLPNAVNLWRPNGTVLQSEVLTLDEALHFVKQARDLAGRLEAILIDGHDHVVDGDVVRAAGRIEDCSICETAYQRQQEASLA